MRYGVTTSSPLVSMTVYFTPGTVGEALSLARKAEPSSCCTQAVQVVDSRLFTPEMKSRSVPSTVSPSRVVP